MAVFMSTTHTHSGLHFLRIFSSPILVNMEDCFMCGDSCENHILESPPSRLRKDSVSVFESKLAFPDFLYTLPPSFSLFFPFVCLFQHDLQWNYPSSYTSGQVPREQTPPCSTLEGSASPLYVLNIAIPLNNITSDQYRLTPCVPSAMSP